MSKAVELKKAMQDAAYVSDKIELKTAVQQGKLVIISSDLKLYEKLLEKFPKEKVTKKVSTAGKVMMGVGAVITVASGGLFGVPLVLAGIIGSVGGDTLDSYKNYEICMDYDNKQVQFIKTKGNPHVKI